MSVATSVVRPLRRPVAVRRGRVVAVWILVHFAGALYIADGPFLATVVPVLAVIVALVVALTTTNLAFLAGAAAYTAGSDVLWRMLETAVPWEGAKFVTATILIVGIMRFLKTRLGKVGSPFAYFGLMLVSSVLTINALGVVGAREDLSFNLSGPLVLTFGALFFVNVKTDVRGLLDIAWVIAAPIAGVSALAAQSTLGGGAIEFVQESNLTTSGGYAPNQVSTLFGFGALLLLIVVVYERSLPLRLMAAIGTAGFTVQGILTFSRGGILAFLVAAFVLITLYVVLVPGRATALVACLFLFLGLFVWAVPRVSEFSGGQVESRFTDVDPGRRTNIAQMELDVWRSNLLLGAGPGMTKWSVPLGIDPQEAITHTEFTRVLAEHGLVGAFGLLLIGIALFRRFGAAPSLGKPIVAALIFWGTASMVHSAMRLAIIPFALALAFAEWVAAEQEM